MEKNIKPDSTDKEDGEEEEEDEEEQVKCVPEVIQIKLELSDIVLPPCSPPKPPDNATASTSNNNNNQLRDYPQKRKNSPIHEPVSKKPCENAYEGNDDSSGDTEEYIIIITDYDTNFQITNYVQEGNLFGDVVVTRNNLDHVRMKFDNVHDYNTVVQKLKNDRLKGCRLSFKLSRPDVDLADNTSDTTEILQQNSWNSIEETEYIDPLGLYGLKIEYLRSLDITPPLDRWVHVTNFRCDKFELRDVMELAGRVLSCSVLNISKRYAKVQYSHPLEAVQAVAMLNGQIYFGLKLSVCIEKNPRNDIILPKGLVNIGLGLGLQGKPIRDIANQYEKFIRRQSSTLNPMLFRKLDSGDSKEDVKSEEGQIDFRELMNSTKRPYEVKHVEDLDSIDGAQSEKDFMKGSNSPESISIKSVDSPISCNDVKDLEKPKDLHKFQNIPDSYPRGQPEIPGSTIPIRLRRAAPIVGFPRPMVAQNLRPQPLPASYRPGPSAPTALTTNNHYTNQIRPTAVNAMSEVRPNPVPHPMPNPIGNPPTPGPFGLCQPFRPLVAAGPGPVQMNNPGPVYGLTSMYSPGVMPGPPIGMGHRPGPMHGPRQITGPPVVHVPGPAPGPGPGPSSEPVRPSGPGPVMNPASAAGPGTIAPPGTKVDVEFANLPPSTTFPFLCEKLSQCGQVMSLRFTTPGCAVATFGHHTHAERCFQNYNGMIVEGYRISVTLV